MTTPQFPSATILGYPRIGPRRELKRAIESFWAGNSDLSVLTETAARLRARTRDHLAQLGLTEDSAIPSDFSYYDQVLDAAVMLGAIPERFSHLVGASGTVDLAGYFTIARGEGDLAPLEMTKWFDSNYHYLVPELSEKTQLAVRSERAIEEFVEHLRTGVLTRPVVVGPLTFLLLSKPAPEAAEGFAPLDLVDQAIAAYTDLLARFAKAGAQWIQLDEPILVTDTIDVPRAEVLAAARRIYDALGGAADRPAIFVSAPYNTLGDALPVLAGTPVEAIGVDLVRGSLPSEPVAGKTLVAGVVDGHNVWATDLAAAVEAASALAELAPQVAVASSTSLFHVPHTLKDETRLNAQLRSWLAFADEKVGEVRLIAAALADPSEVADQITERSEVLAAREQAPGVRMPRVRDRVAGLGEADYTRTPYAERKPAQDRALNLPLLPTTTIGSFPQTRELRAARAKLRRGELTAAHYEDHMREEIKRVVELQERLGLDVLVHGEPERNDMVQYFAENLAGFAVTENGWVQSYGSRCTRPSILWGDVYRPAPITVPWSSYTQSLTAKPVKGMLTGPVTILAWSFVRNDQPLGDTARQVALALRDEIIDLEAAGIGIIQVDEPALRELLPLRASDHAAYLDWSVNSFKLATSGVRDATQIHTHLCYSEFGEVIGAIDGLDADVTSIEAARSKMEILPAVAESGFARQIGPGVYDIHSPRVPSVEEIRELLTAAVRALDPAQLWVNPDCGLKTRGYAEVEKSLANMVAATAEVRASLK